MPDDTAALEAQPAFGSFEWAKQIAAAQTQPTRQDRLLLAKVQTQCALGMLPIATDMAAA